MTLYEFNMTLDELARGGALHLIKSEMRMDRDDKTKQVGWDYEILIPGRHFAKQVVKTDHMTPKITMEEIAAATAAGGMIEVTFEGFRIAPFSTAGNSGISARATDIIKVKATAQSAQAKPQPAPKSVK